jgi:1,4-alpha-glucan branching enzyme
MFTHPGKKLLFMGTEFGQGTEWNSANVLDWYVLEYPLHQGIKQLVSDLNHLYADSPALHHSEFDWQGFEWINCSDAAHSILSYLRKDDQGNMMITILNLTPVPRPHYRVGVPMVGEYVEIFNSDSEFYGGSNTGNGSNPITAEEREWDGRSHSIPLVLPPLAGIVLKLVENG